MILPAPSYQLSEQPSIETLLDMFHSYMKSNKRINSSPGVRLSNTERAYLSNVKQFLLWLNQVQVELPKTTIELRNLVIRYEKALSSTELKRNSKALKQNSIRKFFEFLDFLYGLNLDLSKCFSAGFVSSSDPDAFKSQVRISQQVFDAVREVAQGGSESDRWLFYFLAWGCRRSEICTVKVENVDLVNREINVWQHKQQSFKKIPVPNWLVQLPSAPFLVRSAKSRGQEPVSEQFIYEKCKEWIAATPFAGTKITCHSFRRYFVGNLLKQGASETNIAQLGGWKGAQMLYRYGWDTSLANNPIIENNLVKY